MVACGARPAFEPYDRLFWCEKGKAPSLIDRLARLQRDIHLVAWHSLVPDGGSSNSSINSWGTLQCRRTRLRFWLGPSLNVEMGLEGDFLAFGRQKPRFFGRSHVDRLLANLSEELVRHGAIELKITLVSK